MNVKLELWSGSWPWYHVLFELFKAFHWPWKVLKCLKLNEQHLVFKYHKSRSFLGQWKAIEIESGNLDMCYMSVQFIKKSLSFVLNSFSGWQRRPSGVPEGWSMVAHRGQYLGGPLHRAEQTKCLRQRHLLSGLDLPSDEGKHQIKQLKKIRISMYCMYRYFAAFGICLEHQM